jgi:hypothetical protein
MKENAKSRDELSPFVGRNKTPISFDNFVRGDKVPR